MDAIFFNFLLCKILSLIKKPRSLEEESPQSFLSAQSHKLN